MFVVAGRDGGAARGYFRYNRVHRVSLVLASVGNGADGVTSAVESLPTEEWISNRGGEVF